PTSADPHHYAAAPNSTLHDHIFEALVELDARLKPQPSLAASWTRRDDLTWEFRIRPGVRFHNGQALTAADVVFTFCRILNNDNEMATSYSQYVRRLNRVEAVGEDVVVIG